MKVRLVRLGERVRTVDIPDKGATVAEVLCLAGENPDNLDGFQVRVGGEPVELDRPVRPGEGVVLIPEVKGG